MTSARNDRFERFLAVLAMLQAGYYTGQYGGRRYNVTIERSAKDRVTKLFARELAGSDIVSFNLFMVGDKRAILKPCEMSSEKVIDFVLQFEPTAQHEDRNNREAMAMT